MICPKCGAKMHMHMISAGGDGLQLDVMESIPICDPCIAKAVAKSRQTEQDTQAKSEKLSTPPASVPPI